MSKRETTFIYSAFTIAMLALMFSDAHAQEAPTMQLGAPAAAPAAYLRLCADQPQVCSAKDPHAVRVQALATLARQSENEGGATAAINWNQAFATARAQRAAKAPAGQKVNWSEAFSKARERRQAAAQAEVTAEEAPIALASDAKTQKLLKKVNAQVNRTLERASDDSLYGRSDVWSLPLSSGGRTAGDCEDYVLEKRKALLDAGVPPQALSIAVVKTTAGQGHAVLLVRTDKGEFAMDNLTPWIVRWDETGYTWDRRQVAGSAFHWASVATKAS